MQPVRLDETRNGRIKPPLAPTAHDGYTELGAISFCVNSKGLSRLFHQDRQEDPSSRKTCIFQAIACGESIMCSMCTNENERQQNSKSLSLPTR